MSKRGVERVPEWRYYAMTSQRALYDLATCPDCDYSVRERLRMIALSRITSRDNHAGFGHGELLNAMHHVVVDKTSGEVRVERIRPQALDEAILSAVDRGDLVPGSMRCCLIVPRFDLVTPYDKRTQRFATWQVDCEHMEKHEARAKVQIKTLRTASRGSEMRRQRRPWAESARADQESRDG